MAEQKRSPGYGPASRAALYPVLCVRDGAGGILRVSLPIKVRRKTWVRWMKTAIAAPTGTKSRLEPRGCSGRADAFAACLVCFARKGITLGFFLALTISSHLSCLMRKHRRAYIVPTWDSAENYIDLLCAFNLPALTLWGLLPRNDRRKLPPLMKTAATQHSTARSFPTLGGSEPSSPRL
jgi:hypothetical protein